jgi:hypothetical protein
VFAEFCGDTRALLWHRVVGSSMSNIETKIIADVSSLQTQYSIAAAQTRALSNEFNALAREAVKTGDMTGQLKAQMTALAAPMLQAKAQAAELKDQLSTAGQSAVEFGSAIESVRGSLAQVGIGLSVGAVVAFGKGLLENAASLQEESDMLGISTEALQTYQYAARESGVSTEQADMFLKHFTASLGEAEQNGLAPAAKAFEQLGLTVDQLAADPTNAVYLFAAAIKNSKLPAEQLQAILKEVGGRSGQDVNAMMVKLAQGFAELAKQGHAANQVLNPETTRAAAEAKNKLAELWTGFENVTATTLVDFIDQGKAAYNTITSLGNAAFEAANKMAGIHAPTIWNKKDDPYAVGAGGLSKPTVNPPVPKIETEEDVRRAQEAARRMAEEQARIAREASTELEAMYKNDADRDVAIAKVALDQKKQLLADEFEAHTITEKQKYDQTVAAIQKEMAAEKAAQDEILRSTNASIVQMNAATNQKVIIDAQANAQISAAHRQLTAELKAEDDKRLQSWRRVNQEAENLESEFFSTVLSKRQSLGTSLEQVGLKLLQSELTNDAKALTEHLLSNVEKLNSDKATAQGGLLFKLLALAREQVLTQAAEGGKTAAVAAGNAARVASTTAGAAAGTAAEHAAGATTITADAAKAAAGAYQSVSQIPYVGWILAPAAAAVAFSAVEAFGSFDQGTNYVPSNMIAQIHEGERIIPRADNAELMDALRGGGGGGGIINIHAMDARSVRNLFNHPVNARNISKIVAGAQTANQSYRPKY